MEDLNLNRECNVFDPRCYDSDQDQLLDLIRRVWTEPPGPILKEMLGGKLPMLSTWPKSVQSKPIDKWNHADVEQFGIAGKTIATLFHLRDIYEEREQDLKWLAGFVNETEQKLEEAEEQDRYGDKKRWMQLEPGWADRLKKVMLNHQKHTKLNWGTKEQQAAEMAQAAYIHHDRARLMHYVNNVSSLGKDGWKVDFELSNELGTVFTHPEKGAHLAFRGSENPLKNPRDWLKNVVNATGMEGSVEKVRKMANRMIDAIGVSNELERLNRYQQIKDGLGQFDQQHRTQEKLVKAVIEKYGKFSSSGHSRGGASAGQVLRDYQSFVTEVHAFNGAPFRGVESLGPKYKPYSVHGDLVSLHNQQIVHEKGGNTHIAPRYGKNPLDFHDLSQFTGLKKDGPMRPSEYHELEMRPEKLGKFSTAARTITFSAIKGIGAGFVAELGANLIGLDAEKLGRFSHDALVGSVAESLLRFNRTFLSAAPGGAVGAVVLDKVNELTSNMHPVARAVSSTSAAMIAQRLATIGTSAALEGVGAVVGGEIGAGIASFAAESSLFGPIGWMAALGELALGSAIMLLVNVHSDHQRADAERALKEKIKKELALAEPPIKLESTDPKMDKLIDLFAHAKPDDNLQNEIAEIVFPERMAEARKQQALAEARQREFYDKWGTYIEAGKRAGMGLVDYLDYLDAKNQFHQERRAERAAYDNAWFIQDHTRQVENADGTVRSVTVAVS
jgi:hypothetical protein